MNPTIVSLTARGLVGRRRALFLFVLPGVTLVIAAAIRLAAGVDHQLTAELLGGLMVGTVLPLLGVIVGTGVLGPEIDDGSIVYLLAKPIARPTIIVSKLLVAVVAITVFGAIPAFVAALIMSGFGEGLAVGYLVGSFAAGVAYSALFLMLAVLTRHAVVIGLIYALVWESLIGGLVPGAQTLSIQQWGLAIVEQVSTHPAVSSAVGLGTAIVLLLVVTLGATAFAGERLRSLTLTSAE